MYDLDCMIFMINSNRFVSQSFGLMCPVRVIVIFDIVFFMNYMADMNCCFLNKLGVSGEDSVLS